MAATAEIRPPTSLKVPNATCLIKTLTATSKKTNCAPDENDLLIDLRDLFAEDDEAEDEARY